MPNLGWSSLPVRERPPSVMEQEMSGTAGCVQSSLQRTDEAFEIVAFFEKGVYV